MKFKLLCAAIAFLFAASVFMWRTQTEYKPGLSTQEATDLTQHVSVPPQFDDKSLFLTPIKLSKQTPSVSHVTGITVPHHLLARDLIADAFKFASAGNFTRVLLFSPDHFNLGETDVSVSQSDFSTVFGTLSADTLSVETLEQLPFVKNQNFFYREHGLGAELPFIKYYFPNAKIIALTFKESTPKTELEQIVDVLKKVLDKNTLVVQSTDFSHYLTASEAEVRDEQTIKVLESSNPDLLFGLNQPANTDSIACQYVQMRLQNEFFSSKFTLLDHKNSQDYTKEKVSSTTSYIVQGYTMP